jgi:4-hydroxybenzoate polyprenyltransferase
MKRQLKGFIRLTRYKEYPFFVIITTLLGAATAHGFIGWKLIGVLIANLLAVAFAFMINDVDDALDPAKVKRNPISAADLSARTGRWASYGAALASGMVYAFLGLWPFITGLGCLVIAYLYSWRRVRLKSMPFADLASHCLMLAGLQFLSAYFSFEPVPFSRWVYPFLFVVTFSLYGELFNELRDLKVDRKAGLTHTADLIGHQAAYWLMIGLGLTGIGSGVVTIFIIRLIPPMVLLIWAILTIILVVPKFFLFRQHSSHLTKQESLHKPFEIAAAFALLIQFIIPWAAGFFSLTYFHGW